jgi:hypothetical protein
VREGAYGLRPPCTYTDPPLLLPIGKYATARELPLHSRSVAQDRKSAMLLRESLPTYERRVKTELLYGAHAAVRDIDVVFLGPDMPNARTRPAGIPDDYTKINPVL